MVRTFLVMAQTSENQDSLAQTLTLCFHISPKIGIDHESLKTGSINIILTEYRLPP